MTIYFDSKEAFYDCAKESGVNNASRKLFKQFKFLSDLESKDKRQNVVIRGETFAVSIKSSRDLIECRQYDEDYVGLITLDVEQGKVLITDKNNLTLGGRSLTRINGKHSHTVKSKQAKETNNMMFW